MSYADPIWLEGRRKYWTRPDGYRFFKPGCPEAKMPGWLDPWATRVRMQEAAEDEARVQAEAAQEDFERDLLQLRWEVKKLKLEHELWCFEQKYSPDQPRVPAGSSQGGQWTSGDESGTSTEGQDQGLSNELLAQDRRSFVGPGPGQEPRRDLAELDAIARDPAIRARIDEAWARSDPNGFGREQGFWISRNDATGEPFTRPFANPGGPATIVPGQPPSDAIGSFHTHPARPDFGGYPGPSPGDELYAARTGLPGLLQSHTGMYYFGPLLRMRRAP